jgi:hypothetical protein
MKLLKKSNPEDLPENGDYMFRYDVDTYYNHNTRLECRVFIITSRTPKGVWVVPDWTNLNDWDDIKRYRKFIRNDGVKRFAYETRELAKHAFLCRKRRHIEILKSQLKKAEDGYVLAGGTLPVNPRTYSAFASEYY